MMLLMEADVIEDVTIIITMMMTVVMAVVQDSAYMSIFLSVDPEGSSPSFIHSVCCSSHHLSESC